MPHDAETAELANAEALDRRVRLVLYAVGTAAFLACLVYLGIRIADQWQSLRSTRIQSGSWLAASVAIYAASHVSTALAWPLALRRMDERIGLLEGIRIGLIAQIGKYLPGNVAHYVGRGALARVAGIPLRMSGLSTVVELVSALGAAGIVSTLTALIDPRPIALLPQLGRSATLLASLIVLAALAFAMWTARRGHGIQLFVWPILCLTISLLLSGLSLAALIAGLGYQNAPLAIIITAVALAWVVGFLVPGAPAGLGIREAILIAILTAEIGSAGAVTAALAHRLITASVDVLAAGIGYAWTSRVALSKK